MAEEIARARHRRPPRRSGAAALPRSPGRGRRRRPGRPTRRAKSISCVTTTMVMPSSASAFMTLSTSPIVSGSSAEVGSSNSISAGSMASARAIATRCCWPPESCGGMDLSALSARPTLASSARARASAAAASSRARCVGPMVTLREHGQMREQLEILEHHAHAPPHLRAASRLRCTHLLAFEQHAAAVDRVSSALVQRSSVDLPEPDGPIRQTTSPRLTSSDDAVERHDARHSASTTRRQNGRGSAARPRAHSTTLQRRWIQSTSLACG